MTHWFGRWLPALVAAVLACILVVALIIAIDQSKTESQRNGRILHILTDCLTPGGVCYQRSQTNQTHVLSEVALIVVWANICHDDAQTNPNAQIVCVRRLMKEHGLG